MHKNKIAQILIALSILSGPSSGHGVPPHKFVENNNSIFPKTVILGPETGATTLTCTNPTKNEGSKLHKVRFKKYLFNPFMKDQMYYVRKTELFAVQFFFSRISSDNDY